ncbi:MAG: hypothetical protein K5852_07485, partial [Eubacterium sp.]|nr:hypothetical protein [Eubacterium sp.]
MTECRWRSSVDECQRLKIFCPKSRGYVKIGIDSQYGLAKISFEIVDYQAHSEGTAGGIMKNNIIIAGVPRAGKSTVSHLLSKKYGYQHVSMD